MPAYWHIGWWDVRLATAERVPPLVSMVRRPRMIARRLVLLDEVIPDDVLSNYVGVVLSPVIEGVRQPREPAYGHPHCEVLTFEVGHAYVNLVGTTFDPVLDEVRASGGAVADCGTGRDQGLAYSPHP